MRCLQFLVLISGSFGQAPPFQEGLYQAASRYVVMEASNAAALHETAALTAEIKRTAIRLARREASMAATLASRAAVSGALERSVKLIGERAQTYCKKMFTDVVLPADCKTKAVALMYSLRRKGSTTAWQQYAHDRAVLAASRAAAIAAFRVGAPIFNHDLNPVATKVATKIFAQRFGEADRAWAAAAAGQEAVEARKKQDFFKRKTEEIIAQIRVAIQKKTWTTVNQQLQLRMRVAAKKAAKSAAWKAARHTIAPKFAKAASEALPLAVRAAGKKALQGWVPAWDGKKLLLAQAPGVSKAPRANTTHTTDAPHTGNTTHTVNTTEAKLKTVSRELKTTAPLVHNPAQLLRIRKLLQRVTRDERIIGESRSE